MNCLSENELFAILHELPFLKKNKDKMFLTFLNLQKHLDCCINSNFISQFLYFFINNTQPQFYLSFFEKSYNKLSLDSKIDNTIYLSYNSENFVEILLNIFNDIIPQIKDLDKLKYICFIDSIYYKTILDSKMRNVKYIPDKIILNNISKCFNFFCDLDKIKCLDKNVVLKDLSEDEINFLYSLLDKSEFLGRVIDILLKTNNLVHISKAYSLIHDSENYYSSSNAVHYFKLSKELKNKIDINLQNKFINSIHEFVELSKKISLTKEEKNNNTNLIKFLMISNYKMQEINISDIFTFCWTTFNEDEKEIFIEEMSSLDNDNEVCGYGIIVNMISWLNNFDYGNYLVENENEIDIKINKLKEIYPEDHEIWLDPNKIKQLLN